MGLHRGRAEGRARPAGARLRAERGRRRVLRAEDRPPHDRRPRAARGRWARSSSTAQMPQRFGLTYMGADNREHTPYVVHRALLGSLERFIGILIEHYAGAFPFWLAPVQVRVIPVGEDHREAATGARRADPVPGRGRRLRRDRRQADPQRRGREDPLRRRLRRQGIGRRAGDPRAWRRAVDEVACGLRGRTWYALTLQAGAALVSSPSEPRAPRGFNRVERRGRRPLLACDGLVVF